MIEKWNTSVDVGTMDEPASIKYQQTVKKRKYELNDNIKKNVNSAKD